MYHIGFSFFSKEEEIIAKIEDKNVAYAVCFNIENSQDKILSHFIPFINECNVGSISLMELENEKSESLDEVQEAYGSFCLGKKLYSTSNTMFALCSLKFQYNSNILLYSQKNKQFKAFAIPSRPDKPVDVVNKVKSTSITLSCPSLIIRDDDDECHGIISYCIKDCSNAHNNWAEQIASINNNEITVTDLTPNTTYLVKLAIRYPYGITEDSDVSEPITTLLGRLGRPKVKVGCVDGGIHSAIIYSGQSLSLLEFILIIIMSAINCSRMMIIGQLYQHQNQIL